MSKKIHITELVLRDGNQSLIATRMRIEDMLPICAALDKAGYWSLEVWGGATFDACVRFLKEDPWERLRTLRQALPNSRLQMLLRGQNLLGYRHYPDDVVEAFVAKAAENGIDVFRIFDALNDVRNVKTAIAATVNAGKHAQGTLCYTASPVHTVKGFVKQAKQMAKMGCHSIAIKDMAGLLTPEITFQLVSALKKEIDLPLFLHSHYTSGMASMSQLKAVEAGIDHLDTAISAFAGGTSHPPTETMKAVLEAAGYKTGLDAQVLEKIASHFRDVRRKYHQFESEYNGVDTQVLLSQVPGGMMSNLANQLKEQGALDRIQEVFAEIPRVREDLGFPPLVTPSSQIVGTQAVLNVLSGKRYETITNEVKRYLQGHYGAAPADVDEALRKRAIGKEEVVDCRPADLLPPELDALRAKIGDDARSEEDVLTYAMFPDVGASFLQNRNKGTLKPEVLLPPVASATTAPVAHEFKITVHGETYDIHVTGVSPSADNERRFYMTVDGEPEEITIESAASAETATETKPGRRPRATGPGHVTATMPGNVVEVLVAEGQSVNAGDPVLVIEAMKMETEIKAPVGGTVAKIFVKKGDRITPSETLVDIQA